MEGYDMELLRRQAIELKHALARSREVRQKLVEQNQALMQLRAEKQKAEKELQRIEKGSLQSLLWKVIGRYKKKLEAQRQLTQTLVQSHSRAETQAELLEQELKRWEELVNGLRGSERRYEQARRQMIDNYKEKGGAHAETLIGLEKKVDALGRKQQQLAEAVMAGNDAKRTALEALEKVQSAQRLGKADLVLDSGGWLDLAKHSKLETAQGLILQMRSVLNRFESELADVRVYMQIRADIRGFLRFADMFMDGLFVEWTVYRRIGETKQQLEDVLRQVEYALTRITPELRLTEEQYAAKRAQLNAIYQEIEKSPQ